MFKINRQNPKKHLNFLQEIPKKNILYSISQNKILQIKENNTPQTKSLFIYQTKIPKKKFLKKKTLSGLREREKKNFLNSLVAYLQI